MGYALEDIKVVDFGQFVAGPVAARLIADLGAEVIKVEPLEGESLRPQRNSLDAFAKTFQQGNAGKRAIAIDLRTKDGVKIIQQLIATSDVVSNNFRPGVADRLGIGYQDAKRLNPQIIYCSAPGYGSKGPRWDKPGFEPLYSAFCGVHRNSGGYGNPPSRATSFDQYCGLLGANAILMALYYRDMTGLGQHIEVAQLAQVLYYTSEVYFTEDEKMPWNPTLDSEQSGYHALSRLYQTMDDWVCICCWSQKEWKSLVKAIDQESLLSDSRFSTIESRFLNGTDLIPLLKESLINETTLFWTRRFEEFGVPFEVPIMDGEDQALINDEHIESGLVAEHIHPVWGRMRAPGIGVGLSLTPGISQGPPPLLGQHTREILLELGYTQEQAANFRENGIVTWSESETGVQENVSV